MTTHRQPGFDKFYSVADLYGECWYDQKVVWLFHQKAQHGISSHSLLLAKGPILLLQVGYSVAHSSTKSAESTIRSIF